MAWFTAPVTFVDGSILTASDLNTTVTTIRDGTVTVPHGGTGLVGGTSGGIPYFSSATALATSNALTANALLLGGGAGAAPSALASLGTTTTVLHGNASGAPTFAAVALATDVSGTLAAAQFPALTGDITTSAGALATTLANAGPGATGPIGSTTVTPVITIDAKGRVTAFTSATIAAGLAAATQAEMEAASSTTVATTPGRTHYHPGVAKAWAKWNDAGTIAASYNTTSITDTGPGDHTWTIGTDFSSSDFAAVAVGELTSVTLHIRPQAAGTQQILSAGVDTPFSNTDATTWHAAAFGDQA